MSVAATSPHPRAKAGRPTTIPPTTRRWLTATGAFSLAIIALLCVGLAFPTERYLTPKRGVGYALGIIGGSLMLILLLYSARKRIKWLEFLGPTPAWFRFHMVLGIVGPLCILYHSNFSLGATNSNVALFCMLTVSGSGLIGRYIYSRIHHNLYGSRLSLGELRKGAEALRTASGTFAFLPELPERLDKAETRLLSAGPTVPILGAIRLGVTSWISSIERRRLRTYIRAKLREGSRRSAAVAAESPRLKRAVFAYVDRRLAATRRVAGFEAYERLFSLWHALHLPLIFMMIIAGVVHVVAVHVY